MNQPEQLLTIDEVAAWLQLKKSCIFNMIAGNKIPSLKIGKSRRFKRRSIAEWIDRRERGGD